MKSTFRLFLSVPARKCRFLWEWNVVSERRRPPCLPSSLSRLWSANSIVSERSLHLFSSEVSRPPCDAFSRIYKVCNLPCVGFLIFWIAEIKHSLLGGILLDSRGFLLSLITTDLCHLRVPPGLWNVSSHIIRFTLGSCLLLYIFGNTMKEKVTQCTKVDFKKKKVLNSSNWFIFYI